MVSTVYLNEIPIHVISYHDEFIEKSGVRVRKIAFEFEVTSEKYHEITTLLYGMNFHVKIPERGWIGEATISNYYTSFTNLYEKNQTGIYHLELIEDL